MGHGKHFVMVGELGDVFRLKLRILDAAVDVTLESAKWGLKLWNSLEGWDRHQYFVAGSFNGWTPSLMTMDLGSPGLFRSRDVSGGKGDIESFQVWVDEDNRQAFCPQGCSAALGGAIIQSPDGERHDNCFLLTDAPHSTPFEITLDLTAQDRRKTVTWVLLDSPKAEGSFD